MKGFLLIVIILLLASCREKENQTSIVVSIEKKIGSEPFRRVNMPFKHVDTIPDFINGIPKLDSLALFRLKLHKKSKQNNNPSNIDLKNFLYAVNGYKGNNQVIITDNNNNYSFSDDSLIIASQKSKYLVRNDLGVQDSFPILKVYAENFEGDSTINDFYYIQTIPYYGYLHPVKDSIRELYKLVGVINEHWEGFFKHQKIDYKIGLSSNFLGNPSILISKRQQAFPNPTKNGTFFPYKVEDTIKIANDFFYIKKLDFDGKEIVLNRLNMSNQNRMGYRMGEKIEDLQFFDIVSNKTISTKYLLDKHEFVLLDFWGTWCAPCIALTPDLIRLNDTYKNKLRIVSIAYDKSLDNVLDYIRDSNLNWNHAYIQGDAKGRTHPKLIRDLKISSYPTFILINSNGDIEYRGGSQTLQSIDSILAD
ncbi:hypothetical protein HME9304_03149 [Flagellimonas maritima]|uniref:Thioredoxin domain-containing protein n=1 Tax=Flagellimonas maritima TaxID=1383885 RepID=A0A2Z4LXT0_9FLAO|nr:TlpA disulfide reductase family protein [Allomuricauda aurantiaca]AWX46117.1 hypothetical protein HME9304_03149 [Allomuricauda aurantiaca]